MPRARDLFRSPRIKGKGGWGGGLSAYDGNTRDNTDEFIRTTDIKTKTLTVSGAIINEGLFVKKTGDTMTGDLNMGSRNISNIRDLAVDTISTDVDMGSQKLTGLGTLNWFGIAVLGATTISGALTIKNITQPSAPVSGATLFASGGALYAIGAGETVTILAPR